MKTLPREIRNLRMIAAHVEEYFAGMEFERVVRANDLYAFLRRREDFRAIFFSPVQFSRFLRMMHEAGLMKQFVNYDVDTSLHWNWKWYFYPRGRKFLREPAVAGREAQVHSGTNRFMPRSKAFEAADGVWVRSGQELHIMNRLLSRPHFEVWYERLLTAGGQERYPDFTVHNKKTDTVFYWEHFGFAGSDAEYADMMAGKIGWYRRIGIESIELGGRFIGTIFIDESHFTKLVEDVLGRMEDVSVGGGFFLSR